MDLYKENVYSFYIKGTYRRHIELRYICDIAGNLCTFGIFVKGLCVMISFEVS